jgi:hypothetical protein
LLKKVKTKIKLFYRKQIIIGYQIGWENNSFITFSKFKGYKGNYQLLINKNNSWLTFPD